jgi:hypothetical protein
MCECTFLLDAADADELLGFIDTTARGKNISLILPSGSGFYLFGPDKGHSGIYTVSAEIISSDGVGAAPWLYFTVNVRFVNQGTYPTYNLPTQLADGSISIGDVDNVRFPPDWFKPEDELGVYQSLGMSGVAKFVDRGGYADRHDTSAVFKCSQAKAAALVNYLTTIRADTFTLTTADNQYAFNRRSGGAGSYTVRMIQDEITITNNGHEDFEIGINLSREAIL